MVTVSVQMTLVTSNSLFAAKPRTLSSAASAKQNAVLTCIQIWKKRRKNKKKKKSQLNPEADSSHGMHSAPTDPVMPWQPSPPGAALVADNIQTRFPNLVVTDTAPVPCLPSPPAAAPRRRKKKPKRVIFNASEIHEPTGGTVSTFLTQVDFERIAEEVDLEYDSDDEDDREVGVCKFECICGHEYIVICRKMDTAPCYKCKADNSPDNWEPLRRIKKISDNPHNCSRCNGSGNCPNLSGEPQTDSQSDSD